MPTAVQCLAVPRFGEGDPLVLVLVLVLVLAAVHGNQVPGQQHQALDPRQQHQAASAAGLEHHQQWEVRNLLSLRSKQRPQ